MSFVDPLFSHKSSTPSQNLTLEEQNTHSNPLEQFRLWFQEAQKYLPQPEAMTLATCSKEGRPSARMVLLRGYDEKGFVFYTNYQSRKGKELLVNPHAALVFFWEPLNRQIRIEGRVERTTPPESDAYFGQRPRGSQIGAWASPQSLVLADRGELEQKVQEIQDQFEGKDPVPRPPFWGGFRLIPAMIEFWQGRENRLHDRLCYHQTAGSQWIRERLAP